MYEEGRVELFGTVMVVTDHAVLFNDGFAEDWLARSYICTDDELAVGAEVTIEVPKWAAVNKGFV